MVSLLLQKFIIRILFVFLADTSAVSSTTTPSSATTTTITTTNSSPTEITGI